VANKDFCVHRVVHPFQITGSLSERSVILRSGGGEAAGATKNLVVGGHSTTKRRDSSALPGPQNNEIGGVLPRVSPFGQISLELSDLSSFLGGTTVFVAQLSHS
jgi:hypothetical protein